jgi:signal transduction histidine kinase
MTEVGRVALAARVFTVAALGSLAVLAGRQYFLSALLILVIAAGATALSMWTPLSELSIAMLEAIAVSMVVVTSFADQASVTPYLAIPVLIGGLARGRRGLLMVTVVELGILLLLWTMVFDRWDRQVAASALTWLATAIGLGAMGALLRNAVTGGADTASYRSATALIRRLDALSGRLSGGLDAVGIAEQVMAEADARLPLRHAGVFVPSHSHTHEMVPLRYSLGTTAGALDWAADTAARCMHDRSVVIEDRQAAVPLQVDEESVAVLVLEGVAPLDRHACDDLERAVTPLAIQLQAALLFGRVREAATSQERQRIAREVHDGVAQDVASLGYLVDNLHGGTDDPAQHERISQLRAELTRVVTELRHSIFDLRQVIPAGAGLGESLSAYARQVGNTSPMTVHVTLDEKGQRLRGEAEHELLRIAQEAMNNARKHSGAENLWLACTVRAPYAEISVRDDGTRGHSPAPDSQGMKIMRERADSIGAVLHVQPPTEDRRGTRVTVRLGAPAG